jgi:hypothetical protein
LEDRLPTETFPPDLEELLLPFDTEDLELPLLTALEERGLELGFTVLAPELELLLVEVGF